MFGRIGAGAVGKNDERIELWRYSLGGGEFTCYEWMRGDQINIVDRYFIFLSLVRGKKTKHIFIKDVSLDDREFLSC